MIETDATPDQLAVRIADGVMDALRPVLEAIPGGKGLPWRALILAIVREHLTAGEPVRRITLPLGWEEP